MGDHYLCRKNFSGVNSFAIGMSCVYFKCWLQIHTDQQIGPRLWFCRKQKKCPFRPKLAFSHETAYSRYLFPKENAYQHQAGWEASSEWVWTVNDQIRDTWNQLYKYNPCPKPTIQNPLGCVNAPSINVDKKWIHSIQVFLKSHWNHKIHETLTRWTDIVQCAFILST